MLRRAGAVGAGAAGGRGRSAGRGAGAPELAHARAVWAEVAGPDVAAQSVPVRLSRAGVLSVACASASWAQELSACGDDLVGRLAEAAKAGAGGAVAGAGPWMVRGLRFMVSDGALPGGREPVAAPAPARPAAPPSPAARRRARELVGEVSDPRLRALLRRAAAAAPPETPGG